MRVAATNNVAGTARLRLIIQGVVQGVGFRPFVYRLATRLGLKGWISNSPQGVCVEVEGRRNDLEQFRHRLSLESPPHSRIETCEASWLEPAGYRDFHIRESEVGGNKTTLVLPDIATCPECLDEVFDPTNRRYRYPFTNCTHCGPRFSLIEALPYDRANTSMRQFTMCPRCQAEYDDPGNRRFHAQPNACPDCGPQLELWMSGRGTGEPHVQARRDAALRAAADAIRAGRIVAVKGLGGFHLMVDARNEDAVQRLRARKGREEKPFALMFPSIDRVQTECEVSPQEADLLRSREAPIVLLARQSSPALGTPHSAIAASVAPGNPHLGMMLPSNPLHHLLLADLGFPVVATSGNRSDEPICTDEVEALARLGDIADLFLVHNRPIVRHVDDSIVRVILGEETILRRARGYAPLPVQMPDTKTAAPTILALGGHLKNTVALSVGRNVFIGQHLGDLETEQAHQAFRRATRDLPRLYSVEPDVIAADLHPDHLSTRHGESLVQASAQPGGPDTDATRADQHLSKAGSRAPRFVQVQHHIAHVLACLGENRVSLPAVGAAWDGTGYGRDGAIWGGEFFRVTGNQVERVAHLRPFRLPGGDAAIREPRRAALGLLSELAIPRGSLTGDPRRLMEQRFSATELATLEGMLSRRVNAPLCSSVGRLFDAVAALVGLRQRSSFEGQAAMELEFAMDGVKTDEAYEFQLRETPKEPLVLDWENMIASLVADVQNGVAAGVISARFHNALAKAIVAVARRIGEPRLALSGGCFQNRHLTERAVLRLREAGFQPCWHHRVPPNDGGIAFGQAVAAQREIEIT